MADSPRALIIELINIVSLAAAKGCAPHADIEALVRSNWVQLTNLLPTAFDEVVQPILTRIAPGHPDGLGYAANLSDLGWALTAIAYDHPICAILAFKAAATGAHLVDEERYPEIALLARKRVAEALLPLSQDAQDQPFADAINIFREVVAKSNDVPAVKIRIEIARSVMRWNDRTRDADVAQYIFEFLSDPLSALTWQEHSSLRADCLYLLARAHSFAMSEAPWQSLELCVEMCDEVLQNIIAEQDVRMFVLAQILRGSAQIKRSSVSPIQHVRLMLIDDALRSLDQACTVAKRSGQFGNLAAAQMVMGDAYAKRESEDQTQDIERAIDLTQGALSYFIDAGLLSESLATTGSLGNLYLIRRVGSSISNLKSAEESFKAALAMANDLNLSSLVGEYTCCLGKVVSARTDLDPSVSFQEAAEYFRSGLSILRPEANLHAYLDALMTFRDHLMHHAQWQEAAEISGTLVKTFESVRSATDAEHSRRMYSDAGIDIFRSAIEVSLRANNLCDAWLYCMLGKSRESVEIAAAKPCASQREIVALQARVTKLSRDYEKLQQLTAMEVSDDAIAERQYFLRILPELEVELKQRKRELREHLAQHPPTSLLDESWFRLAGERSMECLAENSIALLDWHMLPGGRLVAFVFGPGLRMTYRLFDRQVVDLIINAYISGRTGYFQSDRYLWRAALQNTLSAISDALDISGLLQEVLVGGARGLHIIPYGVLHYIPFHALPMNGQPLIGAFPDGLTYGRNLAALDTEMQRRNLPLVQMALLAGDNSGLEFARIEQAVVSALWVRKTGRAIVQESAGPTIFQDTSIIHISGHGYLGFLEAGIRIAEADRISHDAVMSLDLRDCQLAFVSICESGLSDFTSKADDDFSLADAFKTAGVANVITSLWTVDDFATFVMTIRFYQTLLDVDSFMGRSQLSRCLAETQNWLRQVTADELRTWLSSIVQLLGVSAPVMPQILNRMADYDGADTPFAEPYYWSSFVLH